MLTDRQEHLGNTHIHNDTRTLTETQEDTFSLAKAHHNFLAGEHL